MSETSTYVEALEQLQSEFLGSVKQAQAFNLKTLASLTEFASTIPATLSSDTQTPKAIVEQAFDFTIQIIEIQREYATKLAKIATATQKHFTESAQGASRPPTSTKAVIPASKSSENTKHVAEVSSKN